MKIPPHLAGKQALGGQYGEAIAQFEIGDYQNFVYLLLDWKTKKAAIVDPQSDLSSPLDFLNQHQFTLVNVFLTHTHPDHTAGVPELIRTYPKVPIIVHPKEIHRLNDAIQEAGNIRTAQDGDFISTGELRAQVIHTPGHSAGECCFLIESTTPYVYLLTGDTLFIRDCGRTDLETGSTYEMFQSLQRLKTLPRDAIILPGHHYKSDCASTLDREIRESPPFQCISVAHLEALP